MRPGAWAAGLALAAGPALALPSFDEVRADFRSSETLVLSREGEVIQRLRTDATVRRGQCLRLPNGLLVPMTSPSWKTLHPAPRCWMRRRISCWISRLL